MELEVGVRITRDTGDLTFASTETEAVFVLAAHLPGFTKDEIEVAMNEGDGQISIRGGGHIAFQEAVIASRVAITREVSTECFDESFPVPGSVDLDGIDAWFDEEEKILIISIPKLLTNGRSLIGEAQEPTEEKNGESELHEVLEAEPFETKKEEKELPKEQDEGKLNGGPVYEKPISAEWPETGKPEIELRGTKEDEKPKLTGTDREKRSSFETKDESKDDHQKEEKIEQCLEKPTEKPSLLIKEEAKQQKSKEKVEKEMHQPEEAWSQGKKNHTEELPHDKPKTEKLPEPRELHQKDGKPQLEITDQVMETKHLTKSQELEHEKPATVQKDKKSKDVGLPDKELRSLHGFKDDEAGQLKGPDIDAFRAREQLKPKELPLDLHKQKTEKPTLKAPKEMREAAEPTKTEKEWQPEEQEVHEQKTPVELSLEKTRTMKFKGSKEHGQKPEQDRVSALEQVLEEAAQDIQSESEEELKQYEHEGQEDTEPIVVPACEKPQTEEPKPRVYELYEDEDHQWIGPDREASKTRMSLELEEKYKNLQQEEEIIKLKAEKPTEKAQKQPLKVEEPAKLEEKEAKQRMEKPEEQEPSEHRKSTVHPPYEKQDSKQSAESKNSDKKHKPKVRELVQMLEAAEAQPEEQEGLKQHEQEVQEHEKAIVVPACEKPHVTTPNEVLEVEEHFQSELEKVYQQDDQELQKQEIPTVMPTSKKPKASEFAKKEAPKPQIYELQECKNHQWMGPDIDISPNKKSFKLGEAKRIEQATDPSIPRIQPTESKQTREQEGPSLPLFMEDKSKDQPEQQFKQPDEEEAQKRASPPKQDLARNGATLEPPDRAACTNAVVEAVMEQKLYRAEQGEHQQDIKSPKSQKPPPLPCELEGGEVPEHDETTLEPPKPLPRVREAMETEGSPPLLTMEKEATEPTITPPKMTGAMEPEKPPLLPTPDEETMEREFPTLIQKELHLASDLQNDEEQKTASRQMPEFKESAEGQEGKTKEPPPPHRAQEEIQRPTDDALHKIFEVPQPIKICEREFKIYAPKELEEEQELNPPLPLDHDKITLEEEVSTDEVEASCVEMDKSKKVKKLSRRHRFHRRCRGRRPAYPIPPSTLLSGSAFVFSIMVLVFHFIGRKKPN